MVETEDDAFACARRFLLYLLSSVNELLREHEALLSGVPCSRKWIYKMRPMMRPVVDRGSFFEMSRNFGRSVIASLGR